MTWRAMMAVRVAFVMRKPLQIAAEALARGSSAEGIGVALNVLLLKAAKNSAINVVAWKPPASTCVYRTMRIVPERMIGLLSSATTSKEMTTS
jgi:hypothetical protein